jgi:hypothetical protein
MVTEGRIGATATAVLSDGVRLRTPRDISDLIGAMFGQPEALVVLPVAQIDRAFFDLSTGLMGELAQKLVNYGHRAAILGDIGAAERDSRAFRAFVAESNRGGRLIFAADAAALAARLGVANSDPG